MVPETTVLTEESSIQIFDVLFVLGSIYVIVTHFPITVINTVLMIKESMLYIWPLLTQAALHSKTPITSKLTLFDMGDAIMMAANLNNPLWWFQKAF